MNSGQKPIAAAEPPLECVVRPSKLVKGRIPAHTNCPYAGKCSEPDTGFCRHKGVWHTVEFSCGFARAFDLIQKKAANVQVQRDSGSFIAGGSAGTTGSTTREEACKAE